MWRIIDIGGSDLVLHVDHDNLIATKENKEQNRVHFSDIHSIICHSYGAIYSDKVLKKCLEFKVPFIICDDQHTPQGMLLPFMQHTDAGERFQKQIRVSIPMQKKVWQLIIREKLNNQADLLDSIGENSLSQSLKILAKNTLSGDPDNKEAQGARIYFTGIFDKSFLRHIDNEINSLLNYAYTIIRSCVARAVIGAGLHPSIGVHHSSRHNPYCLVDDLMEPFRPIADCMIFGIVNNHHREISLNPSIKKEIIHLSKIEVFYEQENLELSTAIQYFVQNYYHYLDEGKQLQFPKFNYAFLI